ncbi:MAG: OadG family protein [Alphaproteobacteria bacterium]|nr:OadG family protein [Alphaproteobacteria bacterium]
MIEQSFLITVMGMGSVFFFLFLLVCFMNLLRVILTGYTKQTLDKEALAVVLALKEKKGK